MRGLFFVKGCCVFLCVLLGVSISGGVSYAVDSNLVLLEEVQNQEEMEQGEETAEEGMIEEEMAEEVSGELLELWEDKERLSKWVFALGIFWFTGNYIKWMKKAFAVKK